MGQKSIFANVLVTAVGGIVGEGIVKSLKFANMSAISPVKYKIYGTDMNDQGSGVIQMRPRHANPSGFFCRLYRIDQEDTF